MFRNSFGLEVLSKTLDQVQMFAYLRHVTGVVC